MTLLLMQVATVLAVTIACGWLARQLGQARVIGEIIGGILIGPSVFGRLAPHLSARLFNNASFSTFDSLSTIGLILYLFLIGMEVNSEQLYEKRGTAMLVSAASIIFPFITAALLAPSLLVRFGPMGVAALPFMLFLGIAMSITAFPVLARILDERRLQATSLGTTAIFCAAVNDVVAWILLAFALALVGQGAGPASLPIRLIALIAYLLLMLFVVRPLIKWVVKRQKAGLLSVEFLGVALAAVLLSAAATDAIGVHPLFGAFLAGVCFPRMAQWQAAVKTRLEMLVSVLLLPLFFALTGMRTRLDLLGDSRVWFWAAIVLAAAVIGKMGGSALAARWSGQSWRDALALGALLNTRGLVELIVLNIAYSAGVFTPQLFTMLVIMALLTTMLTTPILRLLSVDGANEEALTRHPTRTESAATNPVV